MNHYKHFTIKERKMIKHYFDLGKNQAEIAKVSGKNRSSISRELKINSLNREYFPCDAHTAYLYIRRNCKSKKKLDNPILFELVKNLFFEASMVYRTNFCEIKA